MFWTDDFLSQSCKMVSDAIDRFEYKIGNTWRVGEIKSISADGNKRIYTIEISSSESGTIIGIRFIDKYGKVAGEKAENIIKAAGNSFIIKITMYLHEA